MPWNPLAQAFIPVVPLEEDAPSRPRPAAPGEHVEDTGPPVLALPALIKPDASGVLRLTPGLYFFSTTIDRWKSLWPELLRAFGKESLRELLLEPSRDLAIATIYISAEFSGSLSVPIYSVEPDDATIRGIAERLGIEGSLEPRGILEWAATEFPAEFDSVLSTLEKVESTTFGIGAFVAAGVALVGLGWLLTMKRKD